MKGPNCESFQEDLLDLLEGRLTKERAAEVHLHLDECAACRAEFDWLQGACADLEAIGDAMVEELPKVDLVHPVMEAVGRTAAPHNVTSLKSREESKPSKKGFASGFWAGLAAAAALLLVAGLAWTFFTRNQTQNEDPRIAAVPPSGAQATTPAPSLPVVPPAEDKTRKKGPFEKAAEELSKQLVATRLPKDDSFKETAPPDLTSVKARDILTARREAVNTEGGWARLMEFASLAPDSARAVAQTPGVSADAVVGAADSLGGEEAAEILMTVMGHYGDDPTVRMAMAKAYDKQDTPSAKSQETEQLVAWQQSDTANALPGYMMALSRLEEGSVARALELLDSAGSADKIASAYALQNARFQEAALIAAGMDPESARLAAAMTAGTEEYSSLSELADGLLEQGRLLLEAGDAASAREVFNAVNRLGEQVTAGATFSQEELAGLDIQRRAIEMYSLYSESLGLETETLDGLAGDATELIQGIQSLSDIFVALDQLVFSEEQISFWSTLAGLFLTEGDLAIFQNSSAYPTIAAQIQAALAAASAE